MSRPLFVKKLSEQKQVSDGYVKKDGEYKRIRLFYTRKNGQWVHTHEYEQGDLYKKATCQAPAEYFFDCPCGKDSYYRNVDDILDPNNHKGNVVITEDTESTCITPGKYKREFDCCGKVVEEYEKALYVGYDTNFHEGSINGFYEQANGYRHRYFTVCSGCNATISDQTFACDLDGGSKIIQNATCTKPEITQYYCSICGGISFTTETHDPLPHMMMGPVNDNNAETHYYYCDNDCGYTERETHTFGDIWIDNYDGTHYRECSSCGYKLVEIHSEHNNNTIYGSDVGSAEHYLICKCGAKYFYNYHSPNASGTKCTVCGKPLKTVDGVTYVTSE